MAKQRHLRHHPFARHVPTIRSFAGPRVVRAQNTDSGVELELYGVVANEDFWGDEITPSKVSQALKGAKGTVKLRINSPGGDAFAGIAIYNRLRDFASEEGNDVEIKVDGLAASAASVIAMAGDTLLMGRGANLMIHDAWAFAIGNAQELRDTADVLDTLSDNMAAIYSVHSKGELDKEEARELMRAETFLTVEDAMAKKLADGTFAEEDEDTKAEEEDTKAEEEDTKAEEEDPEAEEDEDPEAEEDEDAEAEEEDEAEAKALAKLAKEMGASNVGELKGMLMAMKGNKREEKRNARARLLDKNKAYISPCDYDSLMSASADEVKGYLKMAKQRPPLAGHNHRQARQEAPKEDIELTDEQRSLVARFPGVDPNSKEFKSTLSTIRNGVVGWITQKA